MPGFFALGVMNPEKPDIELPFGKLRPDGMALEFTVTPTSDVNEMIERLRTNLLETRLIAQRASGCELNVEPMFHTDFWYINKLPESFGDACSLQILGCAPDICIYGGPKIERPDPKTFPYRSSGGHVHIELGRDMVSDLAAVNFTVAALDLFMGTAATYLSTNRQAYERKRLYGQAGMIRANAKLGTIEYRTLSAQALLQTEEVARLMFSMAQEVAEHIRNIYMSISQPQFISEMKQLVGNFAYLANDVAGAINRHDVDACRMHQDTAANRWHANSAVTSLVDKLQTYVLPNHFNLVWEGI